MEDPGIVGTHLEAVVDHRVPDHKATRAPVRRVMELEAGHKVTAVDRKEPADRRVTAVDSSQEAVVDTADLAPMDHRAKVGSCLLPCRNSQHSQAVDRNVKSVAVRKYQHQGSFLRHQLEPQCQQ